MRVIYTERCGVFWTHADGCVNDGWEWGRKRGCRWLSKQRPNGLSFRVDFKNGELAEHTTGELAAGKEKSTPNEQTEASLSLGRWRSPLARGRRY